MRLCYVWTMNAVLGLLAALPGCGDSERIDWHGHDTGFHSATSDHTGNASKQQKHGGHSNGKGSSGND
jgi:hypothetical protein